MIIHIGINTKTKKEFVKFLKRANSLFPKGTWLHFDISDSGFSSIKSFFDGGLANKYSKQFKTEAHLMSPWKKIDGYFNKTTLKRYFIQYSQVKDWDYLKHIAKSKKIEIGIVCGISDKIKDLNIPSWIKIIMVLAVIPGPSKQNFDIKAYSLIKSLKRKYPQKKIIIDGGINIDILNTLKKYGINEAISTSYIWESKNPADTLKKLQAVGNKK